MRNKAPSQEVNVTEGSTATHITQVLYNGDVNHYHPGRAAETSETVDLAQYREKSLGVFAEQSAPRALPRVQVVSAPHPEAQLQGEPIEDVISELKRNPRVVLVGTAGSGKTTLLRHAARRFAAVAVARPDEIAACVFVDLARFNLSERSSPLGSLLELLSDALFEIHPSKARPSSVAVAQLLEQGQVHVLLDGLDEIQGLSRQKDCVQGLESLARNFPKNTYVLGARSVAYPLKDWRNLSLLELTDEQISMLITLQEKNASRVATLGLSAAQLGVLRTPLHVRMAVELFLRSRESLELEHYSQARLIHNYVSALLNRASNGEHESSVPALRQILRSLAARQNEKGTLLEQSDTQLWLTEQLAERGKAERILNVLCDVGLLTREREHFRFKHQTLWEYFYATHLLTRWRVPGRERLPRIPGWLRREIKNRENVPHLLYLLPQLLEDEVAAVLLTAGKSNLALGLMWSDDLCLSQQRPPAVQDFMQSLSKRLWRATWDMRVVNAADDIRNELLNRRTVLKIPFLLTFPELSWLVLATVAVCLLVSFGIRLFTRERTGEGYFYVRQIEQIKSSVLRHDCIQLAQRIANALPTHSELYAFVGLSTKNTSMNLVDHIRFAAAPYSAIKALAFHQTPSSLEVLLGVAQSNNVYALGALEALKHRVQLNPKEAPRVLGALTRLLSRSDLSWRVRMKSREVRETCKNPKTQSSLGSPLKELILRVLSSCAQACTWTTCIVMGAFLFSVVVALISGLTKPILGDSTGPLIPMTVMIVTALWVDKRLSLAGVTRVRGYFGADGLDAKDYALAVLCFCPLALPLMFLWKSIKQNAKGVDWELLQMRMREASGGGGSHASRKRG
ncbi:NACHT domain-containing protein [Melittangium boletus]|uniref:NACHT domain-containing protein n=1 Tax=Melittangium boletus TaxID=83453 RepID=UPI003DA51C83